MYVITLHALYREWFSVLIVLYFYLCDEDKPRSIVVITDNIISYIISTYHIGSYFTYKCYDGVQVDNRSKE